LSDEVTEGVIVIGVSGYTGGISQVSNAVLAVVEVVVFRLRGSPLDYPSNSSRLIRITQVAGSGGTGSIAFSNTVIGIIEIVNA
jgi:hypothetical protein